MKEAIAEAARILLLEKKVRKLTVKDIVEECHITRQTFYYHFEGIVSVDYGKRLKAAHGAMSGTGG